MPSLVVIVAVLGFTALALVAPASAIVTGPAMLLAGLRGLSRQAQPAATPLYLLLLGLGGTLTLAVLLATVLLVRFN